jgi:hypothetical protein
VEGKDEVVRSTLVAEAQWQYEIDTDPLLRLQHLLHVAEWEADILLRRMPPEKLRLVLQA